VALAWTALALTRRWQTGAGWIDGLGRLLGAVAIGNAVIGLVIFRI
jgi:hypothetical protein